MRIKKQTQIRRRPRIWAYFLVGTVGIFTGWLVGGYLGSLITIFLGHLPILIGIIESTIRLIRWIRTREQKPKVKQGDLMPKKDQPRKIKAKKWHTPRIIWSIGVLIVVSVVGWFGFTAYSNWTNRVVHQAAEVMNFNDLSVKVLDFSYIDESGLPKKDIESDGKIIDKIDCSIYPVTLPSSNLDFRSTLLFGNYLPNPEYRNCASANFKIDTYNSYEPGHRMIALNLEVTAKKDKTIKVGDLKTYFNVPSGRDITKTVDYGGWDEKYTPYGISSKEGYLQSELQRKINMWTDLKNKESLVDVVIQYDGIQKLFRFSL